MGPTEFYLWLQVARLVGLTLPSIVQAIGHSHWCCQKFFWREVIERGDVNHYELATQHRHVACIMGGNSAPQAEVMPLLATASRAGIASQRIRAGQEPELIRGYWSSFPHPLLPAEGAVALASALREINVCFEGDCSAVAASLICLIQSSGPSSS